MDEAEITALLHRNVEELARIEHERWAHWQQYMHSRGSRQPDGSLILPPDLVHRWEAQIKTPYRDLTEAEKESDREQVRRYLPIIVELLRERSD